MSTLNVSNITDGTTTVSTSYVVNGSAKAWVNFQGINTAAIRESLNISSLTDNATGDYKTDFTSAFVNIDYSPTFGCTSQNAHMSALYNRANMFTTSVRLYGYTTTVAVDNDVFAFHIQGDLA